MGNNPLSFTDPSGFFFKKLFKAFKYLVRAAFSIIPRKLKPFAAITFAAVTGHFEVLSAMQIGAVAGFIASGGDLKAGIIEAVTGGIAGGNGSTLFKVAASALSVVWAVSYKAGIFYRGSYRVVCQED